MPISRGWYSPLMFPFLLREYLAHIAIMSNYNYPCNSLLVFLPTAPNVLLPGLGSKEGWEQVQSPVTLRLTSSGSWLQIPNPRLSARPPAGHCSFSPKVSILLEQMVFLPRNKVNGSFLLPRWPLFEVREWQLSRLCWRAEEGFPLPPPPPHQLPGR